MHIYREKPPSSLLEKEVSFMELYRATALQRGNSFPSCAWRNIYFRTRFSWFDHIFTTNYWQNIFVWFSYHILRQRLMVYNLQFSLQLLLRRITLPLILQYLPSDDFQCYTLLSVHSTFCLDFLRWFSIPFGVLASICIWRCQRYNWPLSEIFLNTGSSFSSLPAVAGVSSISP